MDDFLRIEDLSHDLGGRRVLDGISLHIRRGEIFSLLGPSGCGKTTLLRLLAGFLFPDQGRLLLEGRDLTALPPERRPLNTVFQNYALFPHLTVARNIAFGLECERLARAEIHRRVDRLLELVRLHDHAHRLPAELSGGQKQRVALARALVKEPSVLLLDEPLAALDLQLRQTLLEELQTLQRQLGTTFVYVTHDQSEAMRLSDRMAVMEQGRIAQVGTPESIYDRPTSAFVASFIGDGTLLSARCGASHRDGWLELETPEQLKLHAQATSSQPLIAGQSCQVLLRPERLRVLPANTPSSGPLSPNTWTGTIITLRHLGPRLRAEIRVHNTLWLADLPLDSALPASLAVGDRVQLQADPKDLRVLP